MQNTWKVLKQAMNLSKNKLDISKIRFNNDIVDDAENISAIFNNHFSSIGANLAKDIPPATNSFSDYLGPPNQNSIFFAPTYNQEVIDIVSGLKNKKSPGFDEINNFILKSVINSIVAPLVHIFNLSLETGTVPNQMKIAKVIPLFKKGDNLDVGNYRPISLLSTLSKILERIVYVRTENFLSMHNILSDVQFGFREKHNTTHALMNFVNKVVNALDKSNHLVGIFLDYSKAFDTINHEILLKKISHYGVRGKALEWFRSYLFNRQQYVFVKGHNSNLQYVNCGVPQGSLLGSLLFTIYINDFCRSSKILSLILFADDSTLFFLIRTHKL